MIPAMNRIYMVPEYAEQFEQRFQLLRCLWMMRIGNQRELHAAAEMGC